MIPVDLQPLACSYDESSRTLHVSGSVDEVSGSVLRAEIMTHSDDLREDIVVDLGDVDLLPSAGVGVLAVALRDSQVNNAKFELVARPDTVVSQVLNVCGLPYRER